MPPLGLKNLVMLMMKILCVVDGLAFIALFATSMLNLVNPSLCPAIWSDYCAIAWGVITLLMVLYMLIDVLFLD